MADTFLRVVACTYTVAAADMRDRLNQLASNCGVSFRGVIVSNREEPLPPETTDWEFIAGSNCDHDFSAYVEGLEQLVAKNIDHSESILFLNDSLFTHHLAYLNMREVIKYRQLISKLQVPAICGKADQYLTLCHQNPWSGLRLYISSYCFLLNGLATDILLELPKHADTDGLERHLAITDQRWGEHLPSNFREFIRAFMLYSHSSFSWPGLRRYSANDKLISIKARCIYFEHRLSGEIGKHGCLIPTNVQTLSKYSLYISEKLVVFRSLILNIKRLWM